MLSVETCTLSRAELGNRTNIYKQGLGQSTTLTVNLDYNAQQPLGPYSQQSGPSRDREQTETDQDKRHTSTGEEASALHHRVMHRNGPKLSLNLVDENEESASSTYASTPALPEPLEWDWDIEHKDRKRERKADAAMHHASPFEVDRRLLKDVVREKMGIEAGRIKFLSAGTFHKAYLVTLVNHEQLVARVARRFMPRLKTESEVATMSYLREKTNVIVPKIYHYDSNPYNRLGGEFILMSKALGIPLSQVYHGLAYNDLQKLVKNLAKIVISLFSHRFSDIGSLYFGPDPRAHVLSGTPTPKATLQHYSGFPFSPTLGALPKTPSLQSVHTLTHDFHIGPIISWPFFGSNRGELVHPTELNRGPWPTTASYLESCVEREVKGVIRENEGSAAPHRLHLDPDEIHSSRHHKLRAVPGDESDDSDEYNLEESDEEWEGPGDIMYRDYRRMQRSTFLLAHLTQREEAVKKEMGRWKSVMERLIAQVEKGDHKEEFGLDCHDLSLENVFVDENDNSRITCMIDWESTTTRPLWACAHIPSCIQSSAFVSKLFLKAVAELPSDPTFTVTHMSKSGNVRHIDTAKLCHEWLYYEAAGTRLRMAHRCAEWDGWEEGLVDSILGPEEFESEWFKLGANLYDHEALKAMVADPKNEDTRLTGVMRTSRTQSSGMLPSSLFRGARHESGGANGTSVHKVADIALGRGKLPFVVEQQKEKMLDTTGDICGGRGGELGRRLEAWLTVNGEEDRTRWSGDDEEHEHEHEHETK